jgi:Helix-turn-helix.
MLKKPNKTLAKPVGGVARVNGKSRRKETDPLSIEVQALRVSALKELRKAVQYTQDDLAHAMGVGQGTISRIEQRRDMLVSTLQHYVESMGGELQILATFPNRPALVIECLGKKTTLPKERKKKSATALRQAGP